VTTVCIYYSLGSNLIKESPAHELMGSEKVECTENEKNREIGRERNVH
jgi:hypothetical protein